MAKHPFQRFASPSPIGSLLLHVVGIASFANSFHFLTTWQTPLSDAYGWHFQFLTIIGLSSALIAFTLGAIADLTSSQTLFKAKNAIAIVAVPLEVLISVLYWGITAVDKRLLVPEGLELAMDVDLGFHLAPALLLTLDLLLFSPPWTIPAPGVMALSTGVGFAYWYWVELCFSKNGWYPYPLFGMLSNTQRALLFTVSALFVTIISSALKVVYSKLNGSAVQVAWKDGKAKKI